MLALVRTSLFRVSFKIHDIAASGNLTIKVSGPRPPPMQSRSHVPADPLDRRVRRHGPLQIAAYFFGVGGAAGARGDAEGAEGAGGASAFQVSRR